MSLEIDMPPSAFSGEAQAEVVEPGGRHYELLGGKIVLGPDYKSFFLSTIALLIPAILFCACVLPYLGTHISWAIPPPCAALVVFAFCMLGMTALRDPGFYPRSPPDDAVLAGLRPVTREYAINGYTVTTKWCATCCHYRPPRCSHCAVCDSCVDKFDHHCPWVGTCIGRRNYRYFLAFILSTTLLCLLALGTGMVQLWHEANVHRDGDWGAAIGSYPGFISLGLMLYVVAFVFFVTGLSGLHMWLVARNTTTYEHFRHRYSHSGNPYSQGLLANCKEVWWGRIPPRHGPLGELQRREDFEITAQMSHDGSVISGQWSVQSDSAEGSLVNGAAGGDGGHLSPPGGRAEGGGPHQSAPAAAQELRPVRSLAQMQQQLRQQWDAEAEAGGGGSEASSDDLGRVPADVELGLQSPKPTRVPAGSQ